MSATQTSAAQPTQGKSLETVASTNQAGTSTKKIWIDLDNSPHVPFFAPIIKELQRRGYSVLVTARDCFQVVELARLHHLEFRCIGRHYGKVGVFKLAGLCLRSLQLYPAIIRERPDIAVSHGSRAQLLLCAALRVPSVVIMDYEFAKGLTLLRPEWVMTPETIPESALHFDKKRILKYPGIKEDVYVPDFTPDSSIRQQLGVNEDCLLVTIRPPANEAHYRSPESDVLFHAVIDFLGERASTTMVLLPRNEKQASSVRAAWPQLLASGKIVIPPRAVGGLNLIWHSDLVISGGGTMNREAAALGVPVYSIFRGKIGAVDRYLANAGRLVLVECLDDVGGKIKLNRRNLSSTFRTPTNGALKQVVDHIVAAAEAKSPVEARNA